jgi:hypothetical protein
MEKYLVDINDPDLDAKREQSRRIELFFNRFRNPDGSLSGGFHTYTTPSEFKERLRQHLEQLVWARIKSTVVSVDEPTATWDKSPFPGLRAFTTADAPIFYGRGAETDSLLSKLIKHRFVAVIGGSGSGKSSLVGAGLIPRLSDGVGPEGVHWLLPQYDLATRQWHGLRFTPGEIDGNPFRAMAAKLAPLVQQRVPDIVARIQDDYDAMSDFAKVISSPDVTHPVALMFIDQFEELFTLCDQAHSVPFASFLQHCSGLECLRVIVTLRSDFYQHCVDLAPMASLLREGSFPLSPPTDTLLEMITGPAQRVALEFEEGLTGAILRDTSGEPGALALLAYTLDELYRASPDKHLITRESYQGLGGVQGALGRRAEQTYQRLIGTDQNAFGRVFSELISVDEMGIATRRRTRLRNFAEDPESTDLIEAFVRDRLLVVSEEREPILEVAHEALFRHWDRLAQWIRQEQEDLILLRQLRQATMLWANKGRRDEYLWSGERLKEAHAMAQRRHPILNENEQDFLRSEVERIMEIVDDPRASHSQRAQLGDRLAMISDTRPGIDVTPDGIPDIAWCEVSDNIGQFLIAKYPVTYRQFRCFTDSLEKDRQRSTEVIGKQFRQIDNCPAENVSFDHAMNFCRWFSNRIGRHVRLPTESEWERAACGSHPEYNYPWGTEWHPEYANTSDSRLSRTTAVGMYPMGNADCGACDMSGNVWEWTATEGPLGDEHILRGGSWLTGAELATVRSWRPQRDDKRGNNVGFRPALFAEER